MPSIPNERGLTAAPSRRDQVAVHIDGGETISDRITASRLQLNANDVVEEAVKLVRQEEARGKLAPTMIYALVLLGRSPQW